MTSSISSYTETNFTEKSGIVSCQTSWGRWWQSVIEVHIEIKVPEGTIARSIKVDVTTNFISVALSGNTLLKGPLYSIVRQDDTIWTLEDKKKIYIVLTKADPLNKETIWAGLLKTDYQADPLTLHEMRKKLDLEKFQIENPGYDFSSAELSKCYDKVPELSSN